MSTIGAAGNAPWQGNGTVGDRAVGRGGVSSETLMQKAMLEEMRALRAGQAKSAKRSGDRYVIMILMILFVAGFFNPILWVIAVGLCVLRVLLGLVLWLWRMATRKVA